MIIAGAAATIGVVVFALLGASLGRAILHWTGVARETLQEPRRLLSALGIGWASISLLLLGLGAAGAYHSGAFLALLAGCGLIGARHVRSVVRDGRVLWRRYRRMRLRASTLERWVVRLLGAHLLLNLFAAWAPPTFWDALVYHIGLPTLFLRHHQVVGVDGGNFLAISHLATQLLYGLGIGVGNEVWPAVLHWSYGLLGVITLYWMGRTWWHHTVGVWAASCWYLAPIINTLSGGPLIDLALTWYTCLALWSFSAWLTTRRWRDALLVGLFAGCAASTKLLGLGSLVILAGLMGLRELGQRRIRSACTTTALALLIGGLVVSPWLIKTAVEAGTPWFFLQHARGLGWHAAPMWDTAGALAIAWRVATYPFILTLNPVAFDGWRASAGPWLVALVPLVFVCRRDRRLWWLLGFSGLLFFGGCLLTVRFNRYMVPAYLATALACGYVVWRSTAWGRQTQRWLCSIICAWGVVNFGLLLAQDLGRLPVVLGLQSRTVYLSRRLDSFPVMDFANQALPSSAVIGTLDPRIFYLERDAYVLDPSYNVRFRWETIRSASAAMQQLQSTGITHLLINWDYVTRDQDMAQIGIGLQQFQQLWHRGLARRCQLLHRVGHVALYALPSPPSS